MLKGAFYYYVEIAEGIDLMARLIFLVLYIILFVSKDAHAYFDPGTGTLIVQVLVGAIAAASLFSRRIYSKILKIFKKNDIEKERNKTIDD